MLKGKRVFVSCQCPTFYIVFADISFGIAGIRFNSAVMSWCFQVASTA